MHRIIIRIGISCLAIWTISGAAVAQSGPALPPQLQQIVQSVIDGQIAAFRSGDHDTAFSYAAPSIKQIFGDTDSFIGMVKSGYGAIYGARNWSYGRGESKGDVLVQEVLITGPKGRDWVALYTLRKQPDGSWRIAAVQMKQAAVRST